MAKRVLSELNERAVTEPVEPTSVNSPRTAPEADLVPVAHAPSRGDGLARRGRPRWADEHPWLFNALLILVPVLVLAAVDHLRSMHAAVNVGTPINLSTYRFTLRDLTCTTSKDINGHQLQSQTCTAKVEVRNNGHASGGPGASYTLYVGSDAYSSTSDAYPEPPNTDLNVELFPGAKGVQYVQFVVPLAVAPGRLRIDENIPGILDFANPFHRSHIDYDLG